MAEIFVRGPVAAAINGIPLHEYEGGVYNDKKQNKTTTHMVSIVGWGVHPDPHKEGVKKKHWIVRNSWGQYWGEMGFFRIEMGQDILGIESHVVWATPRSWTVVNLPCKKNSGNCGRDTQTYVDPSNGVDAIRRRLHR